MRFQFSFERLFFFLNIIFCYEHAITQHFYFPKNYSRVQRDAHQTLCKCTFGKTKMRKRYSLTSSGINNSRKIINMCISGRSSRTSAEPRGVNRIRKTSSQVCVGGACVHCPVVDEAIFSFCGFTRRSSDRHPKPFSAYKYKTISVLT